MSRSRFVLPSSRQRLKKGFRRDPGRSILDPDFRPSDLIEVEEAAARPDISSYGPSLPFGPSDSDAVAPVVSLQEQLELDITSLLLTLPGECIDDPVFGVGAQAILFDSFSDPDTDSTLIRKIEMQMETYYPSVKISNLRVFTVDDTKYVEMVASLGGTSVSITV